jgi:hypothetical protein
MVTGVPAPTPASASVRATVRQHPIKLVGARRRSSRRGSMTNTRRGYSAQLARTITLVGSMKAIFAGALTSLVMIGVTAAALRRSRGAAKPASAPSMPGRARSAPCAGRSAWRQTNTRRAHARHSSRVRSRLLAHEGDLRWRALTPLAMISVIGRSACRSRCAAKTVSATARPSCAGPAPYPGKAAWQHFDHEPQAHAA